MITSQVKVLEGSCKEKYVFFRLQEVVALVETYNLKDVNLDAVVIPEQQLTDELVDDDILPELPTRKLCANQMPKPCMKI